ncbi:hypothetical protein AALP_AA3G065800 [Arabis alpina]|uniref:Uncharacterized protein n=1 Tax=Arabis alpina TaxID=50452 RepID=A0A087H7G8_ARAAL|nr:hypothetical protein AALP_AA3G065800 [Arabis alpina]
MRQYRLQMYRSKGFDVDMKNYPGPVAYRELARVDLSKPFMASGVTGREFMEEMVDLAVERYNKTKGLTLTCESIVRSC